MARAANPTERGKSDLRHLVDPRSIVIVGASDRAGSLGARTVENLLDYSDFHGTPYLVSRSKPEIHGINCHKSVLDLPEAPDVALLVVPSEGVLPALRDAAARQTKFAVVFTSGFAEVGAEGRAAQEEMAKIARESGMRIYGPNCPGLCNQNKRIGMMFSPAWRIDQRPGPIGLATQGGGMGRCFLQSMDRGVGVGLFSSTGNEVDLTVADFIRYMADADDISVIAAALEGIKDGDQFIEAALYAAERNKPLCVFKLGRTEAGAKASASHTGSISGASEVTSSVLRQVGAVEVDDLDELIDVAALFSRAKPKGTERIGIYSFSGGNCVMMADAVEALGMELSTFSESTMATMAEKLPSYAAMSNPVDATSDILTDPTIGYTTLKAVADDPDVGIVLYPFPCDYEGLTGAIADNAVKAQQDTKTPILPIWISDRLGLGWKSLIDGGMMPTRQVNQGAKAAKRWIERGRWQYPKDWKPLPSAASSEGARTYSESDAKAILKKAGVASPPSGVVRSAAEAAALAKQVGFPVVAKIVSGDITHKSDIGGVKVGLSNEGQVTDAYESIIASVAKAKPTAKLDGVLIEKMAPSGGHEILIGVHRDPGFGLVLTYGLGGIFVELFKDVARRKLPLTRDEARSMIREPKCFALLNGYRGKPQADLKALEDLLMAVSDFAERNADSVHEIELNPVWLGPEGQGALALDAVLVATPTLEGKQ